ncbi:MAG: putative (di)nucleoside polyphosphate hydrolase NudH [Rhodobacteraceae bacterium HLUCCA12]|nr:MAG: putative (di)nucleoside polyphosphate hydrolase NudH [Rhodobacteraceae bacterium HLUCCA12]
MTPDEIAALPYRPCVGVMLINREGKIFAGQRIDTQAPAWQMPQGGVDAGEDARTAALRELREEIGVTPDLVEILSETPQPLAYDLPHDIVPRIWKGRFRGQQQRWFLMRFLGDDAQIDIDQPHPEFSRWRWIDADQMLGAIVPFKRAIYEQVIDAFREHLA